MTLPFRRRSRPRGRARLAAVADRDGDQRLSQIRTDPADGATWPLPASDRPAVIFAGASDIGVMPEDDGEAGHDTQPIRAAGHRAWDIHQEQQRDVMLRAQPPQQPPPAGYSATTGPMPVIGRLAPAIGDALTHDDRFGPMLAPLPCGHCAAAPPVPDGILNRTRIIGHVNWLAAQAGWRFDCDWIWTCPPCQQDEAWKGRQGTLELHRFGQPCDRHDAPPWAGVDPDECRCTCPGAVVAVDVMMASEDHLGSGRGRYTAVTR